MLTKRTKETAPNFTVTERTAWNARQTDIVIDLRADEAIADIVSCPRGHVRVAPDGPFYKR